MGQVKELAKLFGWRVYHPAFSLNPAERGYPDLTLVRERIVFAELKTDTGKVTTSQEEWIVALKNAGVEVYVWRPYQLEEIAKILRWITVDN